MSDSRTIHTLPGNSQFPTTRWTLVVAAGDPQSRRKLGPLWFPCVRTTGIRCMPICGGAVIRPIRRRI